MTNWLRVFFLAALLSFGLVSRAQAQNFEFDLPTGSQTTSVNASINTTGYAAIIYLDVTELDLPDADDTVNIWLQTTYNDGDNWTDVQNVNFTDADDGTTASLILIVDGAKDGPGTQQSSEGTDPATGQEISETVPANTIWRLYSLEAALITDSSGTPRIQVIVDGGDVVHYTGISESTQAASTTETYVIGSVGMTRASVDGVHFIPLPDDLLYSAGHRIRTSGIDAGDNWGAPRWIVEAWHDSSKSTDATMGPDLKSYDRPLGTKLRIITGVTGASAPAYTLIVSGLFR